MRRLLGAVFAVLAASAAFATGDVKVDRSKPVASPDGSKAMVIDRILPVIDGELENFSGKLLVRATDQAGNTLKQRYMEASQIQLIYQPVWLNERWSAFAYSIYKNANGMIYFDSSTGEAFQVELVKTSRLMGASGKIETELTSFDVVHYGEKITRISNVPYQGRSVFPLYLREIPEFNNEPFGESFLEQLKQAYQAQADFRKEHGLDALEIEQGSESFSPDGAHMAVLACMDNKPGLFLVPLAETDTSAALAAVKLHRLDPDVTLSCAAETPEENEEAPEREPADEHDDSDEPERSRFATFWKDAQHAVVAKETFEAEDETPQKLEVMAVSLDGQVEKFALPPKPAPAPAASPSPASAPAAGPKSQQTPKAKSAAPDAGAGRASAGAQPAKRPSATPAGRAAAPKLSPAAGNPSPTPGADKPRQGILRRLIPGKREEAPAPSPAAPQPVAKQ